MRDASRLACAAALACASFAPALRGQPAATLADAEAAYASLREADDAMQALKEGVPGAGRGRTLDEWRREYRERRRIVAAKLGAPGWSSLTGQDAGAVGAMRRALERDLSDLEAAADEAGKPDARRCGSEPAAEFPLADLKTAVYACFGDIGSRIAFEGRTIDRLTALGELARIQEPDRRKVLFLAMEPLWRAVNGDGGEASPYRRLIALAARERPASDGPAAVSARGLGIDPGAVERWLLAMLEAWREATPKDPVEPWDFRFLGGEASRVLSSAIERDRLREINDRYYRDLGADPQSLGTVYDVWPRPGKDPVAYTSFLTRGFGAGEAWTASVPRVSATYEEGGFDNLAELLHETGHAVHVAAIRTRPAFEDWPDSDVFTEAWADVPGFEIYEPEWQRKYLGRDVPTAVSLRAKYASIALDVAWGLFETRLLRDPKANPNVIWTDITSTYLRVVPHPEWPWWAVRGQLVDAPGYMLNYALGAAVTSDLRARIAELRGPFTTGDPAWYPWVSERLLRFGLERPTSEVLASFLGRPPNPDAIVRDLRRMRS